MTKKKLKDKDQLVCPHCGTTGGLEIYGVGGGILCESAHNDTMQGFIIDFHEFPVLTAIPREGNALALIVLKCFCGAPGCSKYSELKIDSTYDGTTINWETEK